MRDSCDLVTSTDNSLSGGVSNEGTLFVVHVGALPYLHFAAATEHANTHGRKEVVGGVRVFVNTTVEDGGGILSDSRRD